MTAPIIIATPAYRHQVDVRNAQFVLALSRALAARAISSAWLAQHSSVLPALRARMLVDAMAAGAQIMIGVDSDCWVDASHVDALVDLASAMLWERAPASEFAAIAALVPQDDGRVNAWEADGVRLTTFPAPGEVRPVYAIGAAIMIHDLRWIRANVPTPGQLYGVISPRPGRWPAGAGDAGEIASYTGEDVWYCEAIRNRGGLLGAAHLRTVHAAARAG